ncbi:uncharacterized protein PHACADRAFT_264771 [Phanerochaete carnosa HHB-10118-sp]|uniref:Uncharacterized protein n=1 Tax=Phanerochaete carnosa (strain HHB-10118-sp) TaxID=650164 RepID=K5VTR2_PHACS|nr:uncharacterized protein PHACADRAFT_264771 [Phanerochaete carnosa HHB-10118-sp]EKM50185.1 hypothetical protein PHACADRAFT_264771 [Phanerochaete carnosa HHB-10118-sp]
MHLLLHLCLPCVAALFSIPVTTAETLAEKVFSATVKLEFFLLANYIPFLLVRFAMTIDMTLRVHKLVKAVL